MTKIEETEFFKKLTPERQELIKERFSHLYIIPAFETGCINGFIKNWQEIFDKEDGIKRPKQISIITWNVMDHPNDDPQGYKKSIKQPVKVDL